MNKIVKLFKFLMMLVGAFLMACVAYSLYLNPSKLDPALMVYVGLLVYALYLARHSSVAVHVVDDYRDDGRVRSMFNNKDRQDELDKFL